MDPTTISIPAAHPLAIHYGTTFWDCRLTRLERGILPVCLAITMMLQIKPILQSFLAFPLIALMSALCWLTPTTGFFYIACAQFLPFPETMMFNPAQIGVVTWLAVTLIRERKIDLAGLGMLWPVVPWLLWFWLVTGEPLYEINSEYVKALIYSVIACQQINAAKGRHLKCLLGMCLGALMAATAFWAHEMGFPVDLSTWGGERSGYARLGGVRADAVMIWPPLLMGSFGTLGLTLAAMISGRFPKQIQRLKNLTIAVFFVAVPPLVATMTHGAYAGFVLMAAFVILVYWQMRRLRLIQRRSSRLLPVMVSLALVAFLIYAANAFHTRDRVEALLTYYRATSGEYGAAASRSDVWTYSLRTILNHPILGVQFNREIEDIPAQYAEFGEYLSHNVFLDYGRAAGLPGLVLVAFFFFYPFAKLWRRPDNWRFLGFFLFHFALLIFWMSLSFQFYKTFWGFWMLAAMVAEREPVALPWRQQRALRLTL